MATAIEYATSLADVAVAGPLLLADTSADGGPPSWPDETVVSAVAVLLVESGSAPLVATVAVLEMDPDAGAVTVIVKLALVSLDSDTIVHVSVPLVASAAKPPHENAGPLS